MLEIFTLMWTPAKEASVPNLVPPEHLTTANSLSLVAACLSYPHVFPLLASAGAVTALVLLPLVYLVVRAADADASTSARFMARIFVAASSSRSRQRPSLGSSWAARARWRKTAMPL